jgi:hypothetical protein
MEMSTKALDQPPKMEICCFWTCPMFKAMRLVISFFASSKNKEERSNKFLLKNCK